MGVETSGEERNRHVVVRFGLKHVVQGLSDAALSCHDAGGWNVAVHAASPVVHEQGKRAMAFIQSCTISHMYKV
eukprot:4567969-Amphidinium_carterae.2